MRTRVAAMVLALAIVAAGCGGGDDGDDASATTAAGATTAPSGEGGQGGEGGEGDGGTAEGGGGGDGASTTAPGGTAATTGAGGGSAGSSAPGGGSAAPGPELAAAVLRPADFPSGWTSEPAGGDDEEGEAALERCLGLPAGGDRPEAQSPIFSVADAVTRASSAVERAPDAAAVDREFAAVTGPKFLDCAEQQFDASIARESPDASFSPSEAARLDFPAHGDGTAAVRLTVSLDAGGGQRVPFVADLVFVRKGLLELSFTFINAGGPFDAALASDLVAKVVARA